MRSGGRAHHRQADSCARQRRGNWWSQDSGYQRMVCRPVIGYGERLQDLCGELQGPVHLDALLSEAQQIVNNALR